MTGSHNIDTTFISHLEQKDQTIQFKRIDADVTEELKGEGAADENTAKTLTELFRKNLNMEKLEVKAENLKNESGRYKYYPCIFTYSQTASGRLASIKQIACTICFYFVYIFMFLQQIIKYILLNTSFTKFQLPVPCRT